MIYNRTAQDVEEAKTIRDTKVKEFETLTQAEIVTLERGMLTTSALNRIENKQAELKGLLNGVGYWNTPTANKTWESGDWCYAEDWQRILNNEDVLRNAFYAYADTPATPDRRKLDYTNVNAVEKILYDLETMITAMQNQYKRCGTFVCGE